MSHQGNTTALRGAVEEGNLGAVLFEIVCVEQGCGVRVGMHTLSIGGLVCNDSCAIAIDANLIAMNDFQARLIGLSKVAETVSMDA